MKNELFGTEDPVGKLIRIGKTSSASSVSGNHTLTKETPYSSSFQVIGVLAAKGQSGMGNQDDTIVVPLTALQRRLAGRTSARNISQNHALRRGGGR